jgi:hypothetical protein
MYLEKLEERTGQVVQNLLPVLLLIPFGISWAGLFCCREAFWTC